MTELVEPLDRRGGRSDALAAESERLAPFLRPEHRRHLAAGPVQVRLDDLEHEARRDRGVERVAAALEHRHPALRSEPVRGRDHPEGPAELRPRREHGRTLVLRSCSLAHDAARRTPTARSSATPAAPHSPDPVGQARSGALSQSCSSISWGSRLARRSWIPRMSGHSSSRTTSTSAASSKVMVARWRSSSATP